MKLFFSNKMESLTTLGYSSVLILSFSIVIIATWTMNQWLDGAFSLVKKARIESELVYTMRDAMRTREQAMLIMLISDDPFERDDEYMSYNQLAAEFVSARDQLKQLINDEESRQLFVKVDQAIEYVQAYNNQLVDLLLNNKGEVNHEEALVLLRNGLQAQKQVIVSLDRLIDSQQAAYEKEVENYRAERKLTSRVTAGIFLLTLLVAMLFISLSRSKYRKVSRLSVIDEVTSVYNRRYFDMVLEEEWKRSMREYTPISLIMIDIDYFKSYNDAFGHQKGDECLRLIAGVLGDQLKRASDFVARYGGEEFAVVLPNTAASNARLLAERLRRAVEEARIQAGKSTVSPWVTISAGVATTTAEFNQDSSEIVRAADHCLYQSKSAGRNRVRDVNLAKVD